MDIKTEHNGSKKGSGAYWGPKRFAKRISGNLRRRRERHYAQCVEELTDTAKKV